MHSGAAWLFLTRNLFVAFRGCVCYRKPNMPRNYAVWSRTWVVRPDCSRCSERQNVLSVALEFQSSLVICCGALKSVCRTWTWLVGSSFFVWNDYCSWLRKLTSYVSNVDSLWCLPHSERVATRSSSSLSSCRWVARPLNDSCVSSTGISWSFTCVLCVGLISQYTVVVLCCRRLQGSIDWWNKSVFSTFIDFPTVDVHMRAYSNTIFITATV